MVAESLHLNLNFLYYLEEIFFNIQNQSLIDSQNSSCSEIVNEQDNNRLYFCSDFFSLKISADFFPLMLGY